MICCRCKRPIERSYGRVTDLGNYCRECAMQNEIEYQEAIVDRIKQTRQETAREIYKRLIELSEDPCNSREEIYKAVFEPCGVEVEE